MMGHNPNRRFYTGRPGTRRKVIAAVGIVSIAIVGAIVLVFSHADTSTKSVEPESAQLSGNAYIETKSDDSNNTHVRFGPNIAKGGASPGGTYADWLFPGSGLNSIEWTEVPIKEPAPSLLADGLLHYYAYTFSINNATSSVGYGYAGFQSNSYVQGQQKGKIVNFAIWGNSGGKSPSPGLLENNNQESGGSRIAFPFTWVEGHKYQFQLKQGPSGIEAAGKWWGLTVKDLNTNISTYIGEELVPTTINGLPSTTIQPHTGAFGEDLHWWRSLGGGSKYSCTDFQNSAMATIDVTANGGTTLPSSFDAYTNSLQPSTDPNNGYKTTNCPVTVYSNASKDLQMNLGYWPSAASDYTRTQ